MILFPPCKINLGLNVISKRPDGYHELETVMMQIPISDLLEIVPSDHFSFRSSGLNIPGDANANLCLKAYRLLQQDFQLEPVQIHLHKIIPMGAGLGGGSSDGTYTLLLLNELFNLKLTNSQLEDYALQLGSDCPLFVHKTCQLARGRGEILSPIELRLDSHYIQIVHPGIHVGTAQAFGALRPSKGKKSIAEIVSQPIETWKEELINDFETPIFNLHPELKEIKEQLYHQGAIYASMSGSGSSIYGIFANQPPDFITGREKKYFTQTTFVN